MTARSTTLRHQAMSRKRLKTPAAFPDLTNWIQRLPSDACYWCGSPPPAGESHTIDHVVPQWLAPSGARPTAALCERCKSRLDVVERAFFIEVAYRAGGGSRLWAKFRSDVLRNPHPLAMYERTLELARVRPVLSGGVLRLGLTGGQGLYRGVDKLTRGLYRALAGRSLVASSLRVRLLPDVGHFLRVHSQPLRTFRVGNDLDVIVEGLTEGYGRPLFRFRFEKRIAVVTAIGSWLKVERPGRVFVRLGADTLPDRT